MTERSRGSWTRIRYGVYMPREVWQATQKLDRQRLLDRAASLVCLGDAVLSHSSAGRLLGLPVHDAEDGLSHVTRNGASHTARIEAGIKHHRARLTVDEIMTVDGMKCTTPLRTAIDISREFGFRSGLVAADAALNGGVTKKQLLERVSMLCNEPRSPVVKAVADLAAAGAQTPIESLGRVVLANMGITEVLLQFRIDLPHGRFALVDIYSPALRHIFECDGRLKYTDQYDDHGGLLTASEIAWREKRREDQIRGLGFGVSRLVWSDVVESNFARVANRLWHEIEQQGAAGTTRGTSAVGSLQPLRPTSAAS